MSMTEQEFSDEISAVIEARMLVPWQDAEPAAKALATMVKQYIERHIAAGQQGASLALLEEAFREGFSSSGTYNDVVEFSADECWDKKRDYFDGQARRLATPQPPKPAGAVPLPEPDGVMVLDMYSGSVGSRAVSTPHWHRSTVITYGDAREAAAVARIESALTEASPRWRYDSVGEELDPVLAAELTIRRLARDASAAYAGHHDEQAAGRADAVSMAQRFLRWVLPVTFAPDAGISFDRSYCEKWATWPTGTNLFTADEAADMMRFVLETSPAGAPPAQQPLDDSENNAGVATGSRNESPSESVTRGSPQVTTSPASAPQTMATQGEGGLGSGGRYWRERAEFWRAEAVALGWRDKRDAENGEPAPVPQPMTTQGEAVENVDHFSSLREAVLAFDENPNGQNSTAVIMRARRLTGSQP